jgi:small-conductance mechanosensitive channel
LADIQQILMMNLQPIIFTIVIALVTYISFHQTRSVFSRLRSKGKIPSDFINTAGPLVIYAIAFAGTLLFAYEISVMFAITDMALTILPSILTAALIISTTWILLNLSKHFFNILIQRRRFPTDIVNTISLVTKYSIIILGSTLSVLNVLSSLNPSISELIWSSIITWFTANLNRVAVIIGALIFTQIASKIISTFFGDWKSRAAGQSRVMELVSAIVRYVMYAIAAIIIFVSIMSMIGVPELTEVITTVFSVLVGVGISFSAAGAVGNAVSGLILINWKPYKKGDRVEVGGNTFGDIVDFDIMFTKIVTPTQEVIHMPNSIVLGSKVTKYDPNCLVHPKVSVGYEVGRQVVEEILIKAALMTTGIVSEPKPTVYISELAKNYIEYELRASTNDPNHLVRIYSDVQKNMLDLFSEANISLMVPVYSLDATLYGSSNNRKMGN